MCRTLYTSIGTAIVLGRELGRGGEGSVYEVSSHPKKVAKLYHNEPDKKKQAKLSFMASIVDSQLLNYVAWPQETLHPVRNGSVVGFLMPKVASKAPIHQIYSPAHRRHDYPNATWKFLLYVSRNIAASFESVHSYGHIIGDVNQNSIMVGRDSKVVLIDSDSFQVNARGTLHLCKVGVSHFTPPELQSLPSFDRCFRTMDHDNFGLALLIFHVLFGGRHPYSGVPLRRGVGDALETNIKNFLYAYARDSQSRGIKPPPSSIPISILPETVETMFHLAFTERGTSGARPTARQWVSALDGIRERLKECSSYKMHIYPGDLSKCPWCDLEQHGVVYFLDLGTTFTPSNSGFSLTKVWSLIQAVPAPPAVIVPSPGDFRVEAQPLPDGIPRSGTITLFKIVTIVIAISIIVAVPGVWMLALFAGCIVYMIASNFGSSKRSNETAKRRDTLQTIQQEYGQLVERVRKETGPEGFRLQKVEFGKLREELENLPRAEKEEIEKLKAVAHNRQKQSFLSTCYIDNARIHGIGPARKATLRSFGIETAADVTRSRVFQVSGFGEVLTRGILDWKASCERWFTFNPAIAVTSTDRSVIRAKYAARRVTLERKLEAAPTQLQLFSQKANERLSAIMLQLESAAKRLAQAQADISLLNKH